MRRLLRTFVSGLALCLSPVPHASAADWQVRRTSDEAVVAQAARAFAARPDDKALAAHLIRLSGPRRLPALLEQFRKRAERNDAPFAALEAYARLLLLAGAPTRAITVFERAAKQRPNFSPPLVGRAEALNAAGRRDEAMAVYEEALRVEANPRQRRALIETLLRHLNAPGDLPREIAARRELLALDPRSDKHAMALAEALQRAGRPEDAAAVLEPRLKRGGTEPLELAIRVATLRGAMGAEQTSGRTLGALISRLPPSAVHRREKLWRRAIDSARPRNQLPELAREMERNAGPVEWGLLSEVRDELGDLDGALAAARKALRGATNEVELRRRIVALLERLGREDEVVAEYEALARLSPHDPRFTIELIERQFRRSKKGDAARLFDRAMSQFARDPTALARLAELATRWSQDDRAISAWERLQRLSPRHEAAILGLGEAYFQRGKKESALRTWQALLRSGDSKAEGHARLAEVLMEHDLLGEALAEAEKAQRLAPRQSRHHRTMAQVLERQRKIDAAIKEWETVLELSKSDAAAGERQEARSRILALVSREGRTRLDARVRRLEEHLRHHPEDREAALFLAEAQQRYGNISGAITTLRAVVERDGTRASNDAEGRTDGPSPRAAPAKRRGRQGPDSAASLSHAEGDAIIALVRLLRQNKNLDDAVRWLNELAKRIPARAREAHIQIADIELARYDDRQALVHADKASRLSPLDGQALVRIAEVEERAGDSQRALATYRRAFARDANSAAAFSLARLLERQGAAREASDILRLVLRHGTDEESINDATRHALDLEEFLGTLGDLERLIGSLALSAERGAQYRPAFVSVLRRLVPASYRAAADENRTPAQQERWARQGLGPVLEQLTANERDPDRSLVELAGMLGNPDATPVLARLANPLVVADGRTPSPTSTGRRLPSPEVIEAQIASVIALGRLRDERGRAVLEQLILSADGALRVAVVWALGRIAQPQSADLLLKATGDTRAEVSAVACLGVGRLRDPRFTPVLAQLAGDAARPIRQRRAAALALGLSGDRGATAALLTLLDSGDLELASAAAEALGATADPQAVVPLLTRVLLHRRSQTESAGLALSALDRFVTGPGVGDEGKIVDANRLDIPLMLDAVFSPSPPPADRSALWLDRIEELEPILSDALGQGHDVRIRLLSLLNSRSDGPGLGPLAPEGAAPVTPATAKGLRALADVVTEGVAGLLDGPDLELRAQALLFLGKLGDPRVTPARIAAAAAMAADGPLSQSRDVAALVAARQVRTRPAVAPALASAVAPLVGDPLWPRRLAAIEVLRVIGPAGRVHLQTATGDENPLVRAAAASALGLGESPTHTGP